MSRTFSSFLKLMLFSTILVFRLEAADFKSQKICEEKIQERIYIDSEQLICSNDGIFIHVENDYGLLNKILVPQVNWDAHGLYINSADLPNPQLIERCPNFHPLVCGKCGGCGARACQYRCRCYK